MQGMELRLTLNLDNDAFTPCEGEVFNRDEIARVLHGDPGSDSTLADRIGCGQKAGRLWDSNGNVVGSWAIGEAV